MLGYRFLVFPCVLIVLLNILSCEQKEVTRPELRIVYPSDGDTIYNASATVVVMVDLFDENRHQIYYSLNGESHQETLNRYFTIPTVKDGNNTLEVGVSEGDVVLSKSEINFVYQEKPYRIDSVLITNGTGSGYYKGGETVLIKADKGEEPYVFYYWHGDNTILADSTLTPTFFHMPDTGSVHLEAKYYVADSSLLRRLEVAFGSGGGYYLPGDLVEVTVNMDEPLHFTHWTGLKGLVLDSTSANVSFVMPDKNLSISAGYEIYEVSYSKHFFPIIDANCNDSGCHDANSSPDLTKYSVIVDKADNIVNKTQSRNMPPPRYRQLTDIELEIIKTWVEEGTPNN